MIRINLLGIPKAKRGKRGGGGGPSVPSDGPPTVLVAVVLFGVTLAGVGAYSFMLMQQKKQLDQQMAEAQRRNQQLAQVKTQYEALRKQADLFERRIKVIDQLRGEQAGPVNLLATIGDAVNNTDAVWLNTMNDDGRNINLQGMALSAHSVANLMASLRNTGYFKNVEIKETAQESKANEFQSYNFSLVCEKKPTTPPPAPAAAAPAATQPKS